VYFGLGKSLKYVETMDGKGPLLISGRIKVQTQPYLSLRNML